MTKLLDTKELVAIIAQEEGITKKAAKELLDSATRVFNTVLTEYGRGFRLNGFGTFDVGVRPETTRMTRNPQTGEELGEKVFPEHKYAKFSFSNKVKDAMKELEV